LAYIGKTPTVGSFIKLDDISTSSTNSYTMQHNSVNFSPESANHMLVSLNGVIQAPNTSFSISGSTITFLPSSGTLSSSDSIDFIMVYGNVLDVGVASSVADSAITKGKLNLISDSSSAGLTVKGDGSSENGTIQLNCSQNTHGVKISSPAHSSGQSYELILPTGNVTADKVLKVASVSGSGATGIGQLSFGDAGGDNTPYFQVSRQSSYHAVSATTDTTIQFNQVDLDTGSDWNSGTYKWTPEAGKYFLNSRLTVDAGTIQGNFYIIYIRKNTTTLSQQIYRAYYNASFTLETSCIATANGSDTFDVQVYLQTGENIGYGARQSFFEGFKISST